MMKPSACIICCTVLHLSAKSLAFVPAPASSFVNTPCTPSHRRRSSSLSLLFDGEWQKRKYGQNPSGKNSGAKSGASGRVDTLRDEATTNALLERVLLVSTPSFAPDEKVRRRLSRLQLIGRGPLSLPTRGGKDEEGVDVQCLFLTDASQTAVSVDGTVKCIIGQQTAQAVIVRSFWQTNLQISLLDYIAAAHWAGWVAMGQSPVDNMDHRPYTRETR